MAKRVASGRGDTLIPGAREVLDPIDAAKHDIAGSKDLIASVSDDLDEHNRWLRKYRTAEIRHARRLKLQAAMHRLTRFGKRVALIVSRFAQTAARFVWRIGKAVFTFLHDLLLMCAAWLGPRVQAVAMVVGRWSASAFTWLWDRLSLLARIVAKLVAIGFVWL
ncbi:MAG: hypothetical protein ACOYB4_04670, partial [Methyloceanibacter sp.]